MESFKYGSYNQKEYGMDEMLTPTDIQKHLKIGNTYRIPKEKYLKWISDNIRKTIFL